MRLFLEQVGFYLSCVLHNIIDGMTKAPEGQSLGLANF